MGPLGTRKALNVLPDGTASGHAAAPQLGPIGIPRRWADPRPPNYPLLYPKYPLLRAIRALLEGTWGGPGRAW